MYIALLYSTKRRLIIVGSNFSNYGNSGTKGMAKVRFAGISNATSKQYAEEYIKKNPLEYKEWST